MVTLTGNDYSADLYDERALLERLSHGLKETGRQVVFIVGSALTAPETMDGPGVPGVAGVIEIIRSEFDEEQGRLLADKLENSSNPYQEAFRFLIGRRGQAAANRIIRRAVAAARKPRSRSDGTRSYQLSDATSDEACRSFDNDIAGWHLPAGVAALGCLAAEYPDTFGRTGLTTNFDPLIGTAVRAAGGTTFRTVLHSDGHLGQADGNGFHVVHLHGYWYGSDTLHTPRQLGHQRPQLKASLAHLIRDRTVVVIGYGGWDDAFTQAIMDVVVDDGAYPEVIWTFPNGPPPPGAALSRILEPGLNRGRVTLYGGIDCHEFVPQLLQRWRAMQPATMASGQDDGEQARAINDASVDALERVLPFDLGDDRPPQSPFHVGRSQEILALREIPFRACFITGMGGQGKSALAAQIFAELEAGKDCDHRVWRDCKEESERFENHVVSLIRTLGGDRVAGTDLARQPMGDLATIFGRLTTERRLLVVFDNVDHYVDLETATLQGPAGEFLLSFLASGSAARLIFTCRPPIREGRPELLSRRLEGIDLDAALELFRLRHAFVEPQVVEDIHRATGGHAFWIDLVAAQVAKNPSLHHRGELVRAPSTGLNAIPDTTLRSIWNGLQERQQIVLQALAETLRPTTLLQLERYLSSRIRYNQISKAVKSLRDLSLVVVKHGHDGRDGFELHPLIRAFIRTTFPRENRLPFIDAILAFYMDFFGANRSSLLRRPSADMLSHWIEGAELYVNAGKYEAAFAQLAEVSHHFQHSAPPGEYLRVGEMLLEKAGIRSAAGFKTFDHVLSSLVRILANVGRAGRAREILDEYSKTMPGKDVRYINLCALQTYVHWSNGEFGEAVRWGVEGVTLKSATSVDSSSSPEHYLALARRDSGDIDPALETFLHGLPLSEVIHPNHLDRDRGGSLYGNVGRCLQLMGQVEPALECYQKSAQLIEEDTGDHEENRAFIRQWIG